jgi:hypothetical protein
MLQGCVIFVYLVVFTECAKGMGPREPISTFYRSSRLGVPFFRNQEKKEENKKVNLAEG